MPSDEITSPVIADGTVFVGSGDSGGGTGAVHAIDLANAKRHVAQSVDYPLLAQITSDSE